MVYYKYMLLLAIIIAYSHADMPKCNRSVPLINNFDEKKMGGIWYVIETGNEAKSKKKCSTLTLTSEKGSFENSVILKEMGYVNGKMDGLEKSVAQVEKSQYIAKSKEFSMALLWIVATDYTSYAVAFLCRSGHLQDGVLYVATRTRHPSEDVMKKAHDSLQKAGFKVDKMYLFPVDQSDC